MFIIAILNWGYITKIKSLCINNLEILFFCKVFKIKFEIPRIFHKLPLQQNKFQGYKVLQLLQ